VLLAASFPQYGHPAFAWIALAPLIVATAVTSASPGTGCRPFTLGLIAGAGYFGGTVYWVGSVMAAHGGLSAWLALLISALLVAYLALYPALFAVVLGRSVRRFGVAGVWAAPAAWVAFEWIRSSLGIEFPWVILGTSQATVLPVAQLASVTGVYGLSFLLVLVSTAAAIVALTERPGQRWGAALVGAVLVLVTVSGLFRVARSELSRTGEVMRVGLVQGNVAQEQKWDPVYRQPIIDRYLDLSRQAVGAGAALIVWPEASIPFFFDVESAMAAPIRRLAEQTRTPFLIGSDDFEAGRDGAPDRLYNAAMLVGPDGLTKGRYRKMHLVPFGEYVPFRDLLFFVDRMVESISDFTRGDEAVVFDLDGRRFSVAICYESIYPGLSREYVNGGSQLLVTITNDAWFGRSSAAFQHFDQGALRAIEQGRFVVRAANTGISGAVDPYGRVLARTALFETQLTTLDVRLLDHRTIYSYIGDLIAWVSLALTAWLIGATRRRR
jgi:apolipoprotein N-acyltransferase